MLSKRSQTRSQTYRDRRSLYQDIGRKRVFLEDPLYLAGCMLYWGEGAKNKNQLKITNSNPAMIILFKEFLEKFFKIQKDDLKLTINCYTDIHSLEEIENYWLTKLSLLPCNLRKGQVNNFPKYSKNSKKGKLEWGTVALMINSTSIVQEIYGAIQSYASFENKDWLN